MNNRNGKIIFVGISYGSEYLTQAAKSAIGQADAVVGHHSFVESVREFLPEDAECSDAAYDAGDFLDFRRERVRLALEAATRGQTVVCLSSGDPGIFATMTDFYREIDQRGLSIPIEVIPGVTAAQIAAARIGGPLLNGFCLLSLCDDLIPADEVEQKIEAAARGDMAAVVYKLRYNSEFHPELYPADRYPQFYPPVDMAEARLRWLAATFMKYKQPAVPAILAQRLGSEQEAFIHTDLDSLPGAFGQIDFTTVLLVGTRGTRRINGKWVTL